MITREELFDKIQREIAIEYCFSDLVEIIESGAVKSVFDKTYDSLKAQLANTEQLTCESCRYFSWDGRGIGLCHNYSPQCPRYTLTDFGCIFHKQKDTQ